MSRESGLIGTPLAVFLTSVEAALSRREVATMFDALKRTEQKRLRTPAVAGAFYPSHAQVLRSQIARFLREANRAGPVPKALVVPHAGYQYSGPVAASGYALLEPVRHRIARVVLLGPSHRMRFYGLATTSAEAFATPLGAIPIDQAAVKQALEWPQVQVLDEAHQYEHSLEVQLPFLQMTLDDFSLAPFAVGHANAREVAEVIDALWNGDETLIVVSSDLSHYQPYAVARAIDSETSHLIEQCQWQQLSGERACGYCGICGLLKVAEARGLHVKTVDLRNSGDTSGTKDQVVGYGSYVLN
jgi:AmmeMemoRadiSam system protein B